MINCLHGKALRLAHPRGLGALNDSRCFPKLHKQLDKLLARNKATVTQRDFGKYVMFKSHEVFPG